MCRSCLPVTPAGLRSRGGPESYLGAAPRRPGGPPRIPEIVREEAADGDGLADAEGEVPPCQLPRSFGPVGLPLQFEDHLRKPFLRRVHVRVLRLPAPHLADALCRLRVPADL